MIQTLIGIGLCAVMVVVFALTYKHKEGGCAGTGDCSSCNSLGNCSLSESHDE